MRSTVRFDAARRAGRRVPGLLELDAASSRRELRSPVSFQDHLPAIVMRTSCNAHGHADVDTSG